MPRRHAVLRFERRPLRCRSLLLGDPFNDLRRFVTPTGDREYLDMLFWIHQATLVGLPATSAPIGFTALGLPLGIQIMGPMYEDATPIDFAEKWARVIGGFSAPSGFA